MKHIHAKSMQLYAQDAIETDKPWERWEFRDADSCAFWQNLTQSPPWYPGTEYRRKQRTININGYIVPEPVRNELEYDTMYHYVDFNSPHWIGTSYWYGDFIDQDRLKLGLIHLEIDSAKIHAEALISFTKWRIK